MNSFTLSASRIFLDLDFLGGVLHFLAWCPYCPQLKHQDVDRYLNVPRLLYVQIGADNVDFVVIHAG